MNISPFKYCMISHEGNIPSAIPDDHKSIPSIFDSSVSHCLAFDHNLFVAKTFQVDADDNSLSHHPAAVEKLNKYLRHVVHRRMKSHPLKLMRVETH